MHERAEMGDAAHAAYKGGLDAGQAQQLKAVTDAVLRRAAAAAAAATAGPGLSSGPVSGGAAAAEAGSSASSGSGSEAAAERLFRHLDQNGDGRIRCGPAALLCPCPQLQPPAVALVPGRWLPSCACFVAQLIGV
jgi:hypothetical protein